MTRGRAALLCALDAYASDPTTTITALVAQKMAYLLQAALAIVAGWTPRKRAVFQQRHVAVAWDRLQSQGWFESGPAA
jgi:hypothetical protein